MQEANDESLAGVLSRWFSGNNVPKDRIADPPQALTPGKTCYFPLQSIDRLSDDTAVFRFALPSDDHVLGLPVASHVIATDSQMVSRPYTPITLDAEARGYFDLLVKRYPQGCVSTHIHSLQPGDTLGFSGPFIKLQYAANAADCLGMIAGDACPSSTVASFLPPPQAEAKSLVLPPSYLPIMYPTIHQRTPPLLPASRSAAPQYVATQLRVHARSVILLRAQGG